MATPHALLHADPQREGRLAAQAIVRGVLFVTLTVCVVVPHSFQLTTLLLILLSGVMGLVVIRRDLWLDRVILTYLVGTILTAIYIWVGYVNGAPRAASNQTLLVYVVSPLLWVIISTAAFQLWGIERVTRILIGLTWAAVISVALFFYLFLTFGKGAVEFLTEEANVNVSGGFAGATILVYGSLIFLAGGLFAQPFLIKNRKWRMTLLTLVVLAVLTSGRSALILAVPAGFLVGAVVRSRQRRHEAGESNKSIILPLLGLGVVLAAALALMNMFIFEVDLLVVLTEFVAELLTGGGSVRTEQAAALWDGVLASKGIGVGHGVGVSHIRNTDYPWRYEVIPLATMLRVGAVGLIIYMSTFILYGAKFLERMRAHDLAPEDVYMVGGFVAVSLAAFTNPYIESFTFQWMYFIPVMSVAVRPLVAPPRAE